MSSGAPPGVTLPGGLLPLLPGYLGRQRWYKGDHAPDPADLALVDSDELATTGHGRHRLLWALVVVGGDRYQLLLGERPNGELSDFLRGQDNGVVGSVGGHYYYDATLDAELSRAWLVTVSGGQVSAERARPVSVEQSNTSIVFDDRLIAKLFRRVHAGRNPDVEVTEALAAVGFEHVAAPVSVWQRDGTDLAFVQEYLAGGTEGWAMALTSLRNLYSVRPPDPADAGGDFAGEAWRLGQVTAEMHLAMARAFGIDRGHLRERAWPAMLAEVEEQLHVVLGAGYSGSGEALVGRLRAVEDPGPAIRVHGDYHLGQVMRTDSGWYVLDFEGEPLRAKAARLVFTSPLKDVSGMLRSFQYAAHFVLLEQDHNERDDLRPLAEQWELHNRDAFLAGYYATPGIADLLPEGIEVRQEVTRAFELQKALYELAYEEAYRPDWIPIPTAAIQRMVAVGEG